MSNLPARVIIFTAVSLTAVPATAGVLDTALVDVAAPWIVAGIVALASGALGWAAATSERFAAPARAKSPAKRTLVDKAVIEADRRIDQINVNIIETFAARWVHAYLGKLVNTPTFDPMRQAEVLVDDALDGFRRRNPQIAAATGIDRLSMQEILAAVIGRDQLAEALRKANVPAIDVRG